MTNMSYSRRVEAHGHIYNVPSSIECSRCGKQAERGSEVERYPNMIKGSTINYEEDYKCVYTCQKCGYENNVIVTLRE